MDEAKYYRCVRTDLEEYAKLKYNAVILAKQDSFFMKILSWILFFNRNFLDGYVTTLGNRIYFPANIMQNDKAFVQVLTHELVHLADGKGWKYPFFAVGYLFPQILSILSIVAFFHSWWWFLCLLFLLPLPAPIRAYLELRGYTMTLNMIYWDRVIKGQTQEHGERVSVLNFITEQFTTSAYYFMWPFRQHAYNTLEAHWLKTIALLETQWKSEQDLQPQDELALHICSILSQHRALLNS